MKNWKSNIAFILFVAAYIYTVYLGRDVDSIEATGYIALFITLFMMVRNKVLETVVVDLAQGFKDRIAK